MLTYVAHDVLDHLSYGLVAEKEHLLLCLQHSRVPLKLSVSLPRSLSKLTSSCVVNLAVCLERSMLRSPRGSGLPSSSLRGQLNRYPVSPHSSETLTPNSS